MIHKPLNFTLSAALALLCLVSFGCGDTDIATISGTVHCDGTPIPQGRVVFSSETLNCAGKILDGQYELMNRGKPNIPLGEYTITVFPPADLFEYNPATGEEERVKGKADLTLFPKKYQLKNKSGLEFSPQVGANEFNIELEKE